jgi:hypothetical protein
MAAKKIQNEHGPFRFIQNRYMRWYINIVEFAQTRPDPTTFTEKHHIYPKSFGGTNDHSNLVKLTPREHFVCHWLMTKFVEGVAMDKMRWALWFMHHGRKTNQRAELVKSSWRYEVSRLAAHKAKCKPHSEARKAAISKTLMGRKIPREQVERMRATITGRKRTKPIKKEECPICKLIKVKGHQKKCLTNRHRDHVRRLKLLGVIT